MFKNYFKTTWRNLWRNKIYSTINIVGLSIGITCAMLIMLYVKDEVSFDRFHANGNNIYRVVTKATRDGKEQKDPNTGYLQGPRFKQNVPGIKSYVRVQSGSEDIKKGTEVQSQDLLYVDPDFFSVFSFPLISGDARTCLTEPHSIVLSEDEAIKQFGSTNVIGKSVLIKADSAFEPYKVTAVAKRCPQNSSIQFTVLLPIKVSAEEAQNSENWFNFYLNTFVLLDEHAKQQNVEAQMQRFYVADAGSAFKQMVEKYGGGPDATMGTYFLQPYTDIHLNAELPAQNGLSNASKPIYTYILSGIALFILLIACINFINLTVARSVKRAKEIGIRKVIGGDRKQLIWQFLGESFALCGIAFLLAVLLVQLLLPVFNDLSYKALSIAYLFDTKLVLAFAALFVVTALLAGFYPALVLSNYKPVTTLYNRFNTGGKNYLQKSLVVFQFTLASFLIIATFTIYSQFNFLTNEELGYDDTDVVVVNKNQLTHQQAASFKNALSEFPGIAAVSAKNNGMWRTGAKLANDSMMQFAYETIDEAYLPLMKIPLVEGRNFSEKFPADSVNAIIVNEAFVKQAGWKNPIGETVNFFYNNNETFHVVGVVKDHHFASMTEKIIPQLFTMKNANLYGTYFIKIKPGNATAALKFIQAAFKKWYPFSPYSYIFKNEQNRKEYDALAKWKQIVLFGAILTIFISCIGLFGLSVLSAEKRTKEIGIRKVLGASVRSIVTELSSDFIKLVMLAIIISSPLAYYAAAKWLENFPYRITLSYWLFAGAAIFLILIALFTVSTQAIKAAVANPVKSLRTE